MDDNKRRKLRKCLPGTLFYFLAEIYQLPHQLLTISLIRYIIVFFRKFFFITICRRLKVLAPLPKGVGKNTVMHNLRGMHDLAVRRSSILIRPIMVINHIWQNVKDLKVLTIGPRCEGEIYNIVAHGFRSKNIRGLDLISYSPYVDVGSMHQMPYEDNSFDVIFCGWVLTYNDDLQTAANEIIRTTKEGGIVSVGISVDPRDLDDVEKDLGYFAGSKNVLKSLKQVKELFKDNIDFVYSSQDVEKRTSDKISYITLIFSVKK